MRNLDYKGTSCPDVAEGSGKLNKSVSYNTLNPVQMRPQLHEKETFFLLDNLSLSIFTLPDDGF
jgi:hypothetical protein